MDSLYFCDSSERVRQKERGTPLALPEVLPDLVLSLIQRSELKSKILNIALKLYLFMENIMSCECKNENCAAIRSFLKEYIDLQDDPSIIENDDEWSDRNEEILSELRILLLTN